jgi:hypothetical protein
VGQAGGFAAIGSIDDAPELLAGTAGTCMKPDRDEVSRGVIRSG